MVILSRHYTCSVNSADLPPNLNTSYNLSFYLGGNLIDLTTKSGSNSGSFPQTVIVSPIYPHSENKNAHF